MRLGLRDGNWLMVDDWRLLCCCCSLTRLLRIDDDECDGAGGGGGVESRSSSSVVSFQEGRIDTVGVVVVDDGIELIFECWDS